MADGKFPVGKFVNRLWNLARGAYGPTWYGRWPDGENQASITGDDGHNYGSWYGLDSGGWHFDCSGLLNAIVWGWDGLKPTEAYGGATKGFTPGGLEWSANNNDAGWHSHGSWSSDFSGELTPGEILWNEGHVGAYIGYGISVECSGYDWGPCATGVLFRFNVGKGETANWQQHCRADFIIDYSDTADMPSEKDVLDAVNKRVAENYYSSNSTGVGAGNGSNNGAGNSSTSTGSTIKKDLILVDSYSEYKPYAWHVDAVTETTTRTGDFVENSDQISATRGQSLLSIPSLIETPFVKLKIGEFTFGSYSKYGDSSQYTVTFPNYIQSAEITKINGQVNTYVFQLVYAIEAGQDPNLLEKIFSSVGYGYITISYGDYSSPNFIYKEEQAIITNLTSKVDFARSVINYTLNCTSSVNLLAATSFNFPARTAKPSSIIKEMLLSSKYGLRDVFPGLYAGTNSPWNKAVQNNWIATDDKAVSIKAKTGVDPLTYINYLVSYMISDTNKNNDVLQDSSYYMVVHDDGLAEYGGAYFTINKVESTAQTLRSVDTYEVDIGYPNIETNASIVMNFSLDNSNTWALLYNYADKIQEHEYIYKIDNNGNMYTEEVPASAVSTNNFMVTPVQKTWWTQMTQFPIKATLTLKGLTRAAMLMTYVRINALFYGQRHISSGLYIVTAQKDSVSASGYRTTLSLLRIAGDTDYITQATKKITKTTEAYVLTENDTKKTERYVASAINGFTPTTGSYTKTWEENGVVFYEFDSKAKYLQEAGRGVTVTESSNNSSSSGSTTPGNPLSEADFQAAYDAIGAISLDTLRAKAREMYGMDERSFNLFGGWVGGDTQENNKYWSYLSACCPINYFNKYGREKMYNEFTSWPPQAFYAYDCYVSRTEAVGNGHNAWQLKCMFLALDRLDTRPFAANGLCPENGQNGRSIYDSTCIYSYLGYESEDLGAGNWYGGIWTE